LSKYNVSLVSLGCPKNLVDAEVMLGHLPANRFAIVTDDSQADIIVVNTCAFIREAQETPAPLSGKPRKNRSKRFSKSPITRKTAAANC